MTDRCADFVPPCRFMGSSVAVSISGYGPQRLPLFLLSEIGYGVEACLREADTIILLTLWKMRLPKGVSAG